MYGYVYACMYVWMCVCVCAVFVQGFYMCLTWVYKKKMAGVQREIFSWQSQVIRNTEHTHLYTYNQTCL